MKRSVIVLLGVLFPILLFSQKISDFNRENDVPVNSEFHLQNSLTERLKQENDDYPEDRSKNKMKLLKNSNESIYLMDSTYKFVYTSETDSIPEFKKYFTYDSRNNQTLGITYFWRDNIWKKTYKDENTYDNNRNETMEIGSWWNDTISEWMIISKYEKAYNANNDLY